MSSPNCATVTNVIPPPKSHPPLFEVIPRTLLPLHPPPVQRWIYPPVLPSPAREPAPKLLRELYDLSTHLVPAAYTRSTPYVPEPKLSTFDPSTPRWREQRREEVNNIAAGLIERAKKIVAGDKFPGDPEGRLLWNVANRYLLRSTRGKVVQGEKRLTLFFLHANGFPKEIWEPVIAHVVEKLQGPAGNGIQIQEIWSFESVQHGDAALINAAKLGSTYTWADNTRDILNFLLHYLPDPSHNTDSIHLPILSDIETESRLEKGFSGREIIAVGHSFGACSVAGAAIHYPKLFDALVLVDPVILVPKVDSKDFLKPLILGAVQRRGHWSSFEEARKSFEASPFFKSWDPAVLNVYLECGLTKSAKDDDGVQLKMPGLYEAVVFLEYRYSFEVFTLLNTLDERVQLHWVLGGKQPYFDGDAESRSLRVWRRPANCSNVEIMTSGHLVAQEAPRELASEICKVLRQRHAHTGGTPPEQQKARL